MRGKSVDGHGSKEDRADERKRSYRGNRWMGFQSRTKGKIGESADIQWKGVQTFGAAYW